MLLTGTVHPPGGASAVLAATEPLITAMGWYFVGLVMYGATLMLLVALVLNNIQRRFPAYWWTALDLREAKLLDEETVPDGRGGLEKRETQEQQLYDQEQIQITGAEVLLPADLSLNVEEAKVLERLRLRLRQRVDGETEVDTDSSARSSAECTIVPTGSEMGDGARSQSTSSGAGV